MKLAIAFIVVFSAFGANAGSCRRACQKDYTGCLADVAVDAAKIKTSIDEMATEDRQVIANLRKHYADLIQAEKIECRIDRRDCLRHCK